jgi:FtsH-binding integral membrane protein
MSYPENPYQVFGLQDKVAFAAVDTRADFIRKTYVHLCGAVAAFVGLMALWMSMPGVENLALKMVSGWNWLIVLGAFMFVSWIAEKWATSAVSLSHQYAGLTLYVVAQSVIFVPLVYFAQMFEVGRGQPIILPAAIATLALFAAMTAIVFITARDFSWLRNALIIGGLVALGLIAASIFMDFNLGLIFIAVMIAFACAWILYDTSNVLHHYRPGQHVAASLALFASVALLFWYVLQLFMRVQDD